MAGKIKKVKKERPGKNPGPLFAQNIVSVAAAPAKTIAGPAEHANAFWYFFSKKYLERGDHSAAIGVVDIVFHRVGLEGLHQGLHGVVVFIALFDH